MQRHLNKKPVLGVLGGMGPLATLYFYELLISHTQAVKDADHLDVIISGRASTPDRTAYILNNKLANPVEVIARDLASLINYGATCIAIPCNTSHYFYEELRKISSVPILNMVEDTVAMLSQRYKHIGVLATDGTVQAGLYQKACKHLDMECSVPKVQNQKKLMQIIYDQIKQGKKADLKSFLRITEDLVRQGCERIILGCTELSLIKRDEKLDDFFLDSMEVLAYYSIVACNKVPVGFSEEFYLLAADLKKQIKYA